MKKKLLYFLIIGLFFIKLDVRAQDIHFTQYFTSPLTLNPALTGLIQGDWRAAVNFRQQWNGVSYNPYTTGAFSLDLPLLQNKLPEGDAIGAGIFGYYDESGNGGYKNTTVGLSLAYHKALDFQNKHILSLGLQGSLVQKSLEFNKLYFEDQFRYGIPESQFPTSNEQFGSADLTYPDFNAGLVYSGPISQRSSWFAGVSYYHLTQPVETFLGNSGNKINSRYTGYLGGNIQIDRKTIFYASSMYQSQGPASELLVGGAFGFLLNSEYPADKINKNTTLLLGAWYRHKDALAPYIGLEIIGLRLGFSYDVTISKAQTMTASQGGLECSLTYEGFINKVKRPRRLYGCPRF